MGRCFILPFHLHLFPRNIPITPWTLSSGNGNRKKEVSSRRRGQNLTSDRIWVELKTGTLMIKCLHSRVWKNSSTGNVNSQRNETVGPISDILRCCWNIHTKFYCFRSKMIKFNADKKRVWPFSLFLKILFIYLFIFGCVGSLVLHAGFL